jgi:superfamily II DNA or RNA helicase
MGTLGELMTRLSEERGRRGRQFERICKWYLENDPLFSDQLRKVWLWDEWPGRFGPDAGIDLVAEDFEGRTWAIQAKAYAPAYAVKKRDMDTFLSESSRAQFDLRLLMATTNLIGGAARRTIVGQAKPVHTLLLAKLEQSALDWPSSPSRLLRQEPKRNKPRPDQLQAISDVVRGFEITDRGQMLRACGTGKTLTALWIAERLSSARTLVLVPSLSLMEQTISEWTSNASDRFEFLAVCSDESVAGEDAMISRTSELPFPVTTDAGDIASFLGRAGKRVVFVTYQSSPKLAQAFATDPSVPAFDLALSDEAHRCVGQGDSVFGVILDRSAIKAQRRLFMTATPRILTGRLKREAGELDLKVASMDDPALFGPVFHSLSFASAIEQDLLSDYQVAVIVVRDGTYRRLAEDGNFVTIGEGKTTDARTLATQIGLAKAIRKYNLRRVVSFHSRVAWAQRFARTLNQVVDWMPESESPTGDLWCDYVSGAMPAGERKVRLARLRDVEAGERGLLANARCLAEGVDVPTLDGIAFVDPRRSEVDVVQAVGRAIRRAPDKKIGTVVLPVFVPWSVDATVALGTSAFKPVWQVLQALRAHDDLLASELDELRRELGRRGTSARLPAKIKLIGAESLGRDFSRAFEAELVERTTSRWEFWFGPLQKYMERTGSARPPQQHREGPFLLGKWVSHQRRFFKAGTLEPQRAARLKELTGWSWEPDEDDWLAGIEALRAYRDIHGDSSPPALSVQDGFRLGLWCVNRRADKRRGKLSPERIAELEAVRGWSWNPHGDAWTEGFRHLLDYVKRTGSARPPFELLDDDGYRVGQWTSVQRQERKRGKLTTERIALLEDLPGWTWDAREAKWGEMYERLVRFVDRTSRIPAHDYVEEDGTKLGQWVGAQRQYRRAEKINSERTLLLESVPGWSWEPPRGAPSHRREI